MTLSEKEQPLVNTTSIASDLPSFNGGITQKYWLQSCAREILPDERVAHCLRFHAPSKTNVEIYKGAEIGTAFYKGLQVCGSVWHCPVCASHITEQRRRDLLNIIAQWKGRLILVTYTLSHSSRMRLKPMLDAELDAYRSLKTGGNFQSLKKEYGWTGSVRTLELTYGRNGWHPHVHECVFIETGKTRMLDSVYESGLKGAIWRLWKKHLNKRGYGIDYTHGVDIRTAQDSVADYIAKWGKMPINPQWSVASEITKQPVKKARTEGYSPMALLQAYAEGDIRFRALWKEYADTCKGRNQLVYSPGLRERLSAPREESDEELAQSVPNDAKLLATLNPEQWKIVLRADIRGEVLHHAGHDDPHVFTKWLGDKLEEWDRPEARRPTYNPWDEK